MAGERSNHTWQPTVLVNELYLELTRIKSFRPDATPGVDERNQFLGLAAFLMRRLLVHHAPPLPKRVSKVEIGETAGAFAAGEQSLREVEDLLSLQARASLSPTFPLVESNAMTAADPPI